MDQAHRLVHNIKGLAGNLSAIRLQTAAAEMDGLVKQALSGQAPQPGLMDRVFAELKESLAEALAACQALKPAVADESLQTGAACIPHMPQDLARETAERLRNAADMGNISDLKTIAQELKTGSDAYGNFSDSILSLAEDFDFEGIFKLSGELESQTDTQPGQAGIED